MSTRIAFDIDDTLWKIVKDDNPRTTGVGATCACGVHVKQEADKTMIALAHSLILDGNEVFLWSAGGVEYVKDWIRRFAPAWDGLVTVIPKEEGYDIDICFDDQEVVGLAKTVLVIKREHADHWQEFAPGGSKGESV